MDQMGRFCCYIFIILFCVQASIIPPCSACLEEEENAFFLLINYPKESISPSSNLITNKEIHATDCCNWTSVQCSNITGRVTYIYLPGLLDSWSSIGSEYWYLNTSLFLPFQELKSLYLYGYRYNWRVSKEGFERLSGLTNLEVLYLSDIPFNHSLLPSLAKIATLKKLYLRWIKEWDYNNSEGFERLSALSKLEELYLDGNDFNESILPSLGKIASLKKLSLSYNKITGRVPINKGFTMSNNFTDLGFICNIAISLKKLDLSYAPSKPPSITQMNLFSPSSNLINKEITTDCWIRILSWIPLNLFLPFQELNSLYLYGYMSYNFRVSKEGLCI